jgi:hypothetical protein
MPFSFLKYTFFREFEIPAFKKEGSMKKTGRTAHCIRLCLAAAVLVLTAMTLQAKWLPIHNDFEMYDLDGNAIQTRSGCLCKFGDTYY